MAISRVSFTYSKDGTRIAWTKSGAGIPLVRAGLFMTHIEFESTNAVWAHVLRDFDSRFTYVRYDERGCGLSDRMPKRLGQTAWLEDLDAVIRASEFGKVALFGMSQGAALAIAYAAAHPERISHLILLGGYAAGGMAPGQPPERAERTRAMADMKRLFWTDPEPTYHRMWTTRLIPDGCESDMEAVDAMQRASSSGDMAAEILLARDLMDVRPQAATLDTPTLVAHVRDDLIVHYENGVEIASLIPNATLLTLGGRNHLLLEGPEWDRFVTAVAEFLGVSPDHAFPHDADVTGRELAVLQLVASGASNQQIAAELHLSVRTVERHLTNSYRKLGLTGKSARAAAAALVPELRSRTDSGLSA